MTTIIFKNEKRAKAYEIKAAVSHHIYRAGELIRKVKTDKIDELVRENEQAFEIAQPS